MLSSSYLGTSSFFSISHSTMALVVSFLQVVSVLDVLLPVVKVDAFSKINASSLGRLIREVDAMLRPGGVLYVRFSIHCHILQLIYMNV